MEEKRQNRFNVRNNSGDFSPRQVLPQLDVGAYLLRAQDRDLLLTDTTTLPLKGRLRRKRQLDLLHSRTEDQSGNAVNGEIDPTVSHGLLRDYLTQLVPDITENENVRRSLEMAFNGSSIAEIAEELGAQYNTISQWIMRGRKIFEKEIFPKLELRRISKSADRELANAVSEGTLERYLILNVSYVTPSMVDTYYSRSRRKLDPEMLAQGYVPLSQLAKVGSADYKMITHSERFRSYLVEKYNRLYILPDDFGLIKDIIEKERFARAKSASQVLFQESEATG